MSSHSLCPASSLVGLEGEDEAGGGGGSDSEEEPDDEDELVAIKVKTSAAINLKPSKSAKGKERTTGELQFILRPMPMSLIPLEDFEKMDVPLLSRSGEAIGKKDDFKSVPLNNRAC